MPISNPHNAVLDKLYPNAVTNKTDRIPQMIYIL